MARTGVELLLSNYFSKLLMEGKTPLEAIDKLSYEVFVRHKKEFESLNEDEQWEVRNYVNCLWKLFK